MSRSDGPADASRWEFWSRRRWAWRLYEADTRTLRRRAVAHLDLEPGDTVLDVGCGPGTNFELLRDAVGPAGRVVGVDISRGMVRRASERVASEGWANVAVLRGDATALPVAADAVDGALATTAVSATADVPGTVDGVADALRSGGRFAVYDIRLVPAGPWRLFNPLIERAYRLIGSWNAEADVLAALERSFAESRLVETHALGTNYLAVAETAAAGSS